MKKIILGVFMSIGLVLSLAVPATTAAASTTLPPRSAVYFSPHQDDEVLTMGASIRAHVKAGRPTYVVLLTDGGASGVCPTKFSTRQQCVNFRDAEFKKAVRALGAVPIIPSNRMPDGASTVAGYQKIMRPYMVNGFSLKTFTWDYDTHKDHLNAGAALRGLKFADSRYYVKHDLVAGARAKGTKVFAQPTCKDSSCMAAVEAYRNFGWVSVPAAFRHAKTGLVSYYRMPA